MKRTVVSIGALCVILALSSTAFGQTSPQEQRDRPGRVRTPRRRRPPRQRASSSPSSRGSNPEASAADRRDEGRPPGPDRPVAGHSAAATKEKARETAKQIEALISKRQAAFQDTLRQLEQQQQQLQRAVRTRRPGPARRPRGKQAPDFELDSFDGRKVKLSDYKDQIVVLEWINPECPFSQYHYETVQTMVDLAKKYRDKGVVWLAVNSTINTTPEANREFAEKYKLPYPILDDRSGQVGRQYGAGTRPTCSSSTKTASIVYDGAIDNAPLGKQEPGAGTVNYVDKALSELFPGQKVSLPNTPPYGCTVKYAASSDVTA